MDKDNLISNKIDPALSFNVNALNGNGDTGFHIACAKGFQGIVRTFLDKDNLISNKIDLNCINNDGKTGLDLARLTLSSDLCEKIEGLMLNE